MEYLLGYLLFSVGLNLLLFIVAYSGRTDKLTDISYSLTFIAIAVNAFLWSERSIIDIVLTLLVTIWGLRLGAYLFYRIQYMGNDERFNGIRDNFISFFLFWLLQGLTCFIVMVPLVQTVQGVGKCPDSFFWGVILLAFSGLLLEVVADAQKFRYKQQFPEKFMQSGVWSLLQHPNYTGELLFWWSVYLACYPFTPWYVIVGPLWITFIILRFSGVMLLQEKWKEKYGQDPDFVAYQQRTWKIFPWVY